MNITQYFATSNWTSRWGVIDADHPTPHKGLDIYHPGGTVIPVLRSGTIVADSPSSSVGRYITIQVAPGDYDTYCHVVSYGRGGYVSADSPLATVAGYGDPHGTAWTGPHTHFCNSSTIDGWAYWGATNHNPEPIIISVLTDIAGGGTTPFPNNQEEDTTMIYDSQSASKDGVIPKGLSFIQDAEGPLRPLSQAEREAYTFWGSHGIPSRVAAWSGDQIRAITIGCGLREWSDIVGLVPKLTGRIIFADPKTANYPKVSVG